MEEFKKSLLVIGNTSITDVKILEESKAEGSEEGQNQNGSNSKEDSYLVI